MTIPLHLARLLFGFLLRFLLFSSGDLIFPQPDSKEKESLKKKLSEIKKPVHIQVFISPTCPFCPKAARTAHQFALENEFIRSDVIGMTEFPYLVQKYSIMSVPHIVVNEDTAFVEAHPQEVFIEQIALALRAGYNPMYS